MEGGRGDTPYKVYSQLFMTSSTTQGIFLSFSIVLFLLGLAYTVSTITSSGAAFDTLIEDTHSAFFMETEIPEEIVFSGAEVIGSLYKLNFDVVTVNLNGIIINTAKDFIDMQHMIVIDARYKQTITHNTDGTTHTIYYSIH